MTTREPKVPLEELDPASRDPAYWHRFHRTVMQAVGPALARRREARVSLEGVLLSWSRLLVPAAAAVAAILLVGEAETGETVVLIGVEEILTADWAEDEVEPLPDYFYLEEGVEGGEAALLAGTAF